MRRVSRPISRRGSRGSREGMQGDLAGAGGCGFGAEQDARPGSRRPPAAARLFIRSRMSPPTKAPELSRGGRGPEAAPTVGSVLPLVHHGRGGRGGESEPARPQPGRARGSAGCSAPPRVRARPSHLVIPSRPHQWESRAGGGGTQGRGRAREGVEPQPLFPIWALERPSRFV